MGKSIKIVSYVFACLLILCTPAMAAWDYDGWEIKTMERGAIRGDVFTSCGDNSGAGASPYTSNFNVPAGTEKYSRLYVGVWGGKSINTGTLDTTFNGIDLSTVNIGGQSDANPTYTDGTNVYGRGNGVWWVSYNVTGSVNMNTLNSATATIGNLDLIYSIVLVTVYSDPSNPEIEYWINEGSVNLHYASSSNPWVQDKNFTWFNESTVTPVSARLDIVYLTSSENEPDYLYFNPPDAGDSPYNNMAWDIGKYQTYQLGDNDVADESDGGNFNLESFTSTSDSTQLKDLISSDNYAVFWRGHDDDSSGVIDAAYGTNEPGEGESYLGPVFAALILEKEDTSGKSDLVPVAIKPYHYEWWEQYNVSKGDPWFNLTNYVNVTIENNGQADAGSFKVKLYTDGELLGEKTISGLGSGSSTEEKFEWVPIGEDPLSWTDTADGSLITYTTTDRTYDLEVVVDEADEVSEEDESNNDLAISKIVVWNGNMADENLQNYIHGTVKGGMLYTTGTGKYQGVGASGTTYGTDYTVTYDLDMPGTPVLSRFYLYYDWAKSPNKAPKIGVTLTTPSGTHALSMDKGYNDYKGEYGPYRYPWGTYAYDITQYVTESGSYSVSITNLNDGTDTDFATEYAFAAPGILTVYENDSMPLKEYWINEGADLLIGGRRGDGGFLSYEECINTALFPGSVSPDTATLGIVSPWADSLTDDYVWFNDHLLGSGLYQGFSTASTQEVDGLKMIIGADGTQVGLIASDVTSYLTASNNEVTQADNGDNMMLSNAFLMVTYSGTPPPALSISADLDTVTVGVPTDVNFTVTNNSELVEGATITLTGSATGSATTDTNGTAIISVNTTGSGTVTATATKDGFISATTTITAKVEHSGVSSSVSMTTNIIPAIALVVTPGNIEFGELSPGETSGTHTLTLKNTGGNSLSVTAEVSDTTTNSNLFVKGMLLDSDGWGDYSTSIAALTSDTTDASLKVPGDFVGVGAKQGALVFWGEAE